MSSTLATRKAISSDESIKIPVKTYQFISAEAGRRGMYRRAFMRALVQLWEISGEPRRQAAIRRLGQQAE